jgi:hypothetical protein
MTKPVILRLIIRDMLYSWSYGKLKYIIFFCILSFLSLATSLQLKPFGTNSSGVFYFLLKDNGYIRVISDYEVPVYWVFIQFYIQFLIGDFLFDDQKKNRNYLLLRSHAKGSYILAKMGWVLAQNILIYLGIYFVIYISSGLVLNDFSIGSSPFFSNHIDPTLQYPITPGQLTFRILAGYFLTSLVLSSIQLLCIQFISPFITYFGVIILSGISTFSDIKWLPAIHSMILKQAVFDSDHNLTFHFSIVYSVVLYILVSLAAYSVFRKKDIL